MGQAVRVFCERMSCMGPACKHISHCHYHMYEAEQPEPEEYECPICGHKNPGTVSACQSCYWPRVKE